MRDDLEIDQHDPDITPARPVRREWASGSTIFDGSQHIERSFGRVCVDCGAKLRSYDVERTRCGIHEQKRHEGMVALAFAWLQAGEELSKARRLQASVRTINAQIKRISVQVVALGIGMLSSPYKGYRGDPHTDLIEVLPLRPTRLTAYLGELYENGNIRRSENGHLHLCVLPHASDGELYHEELRGPDAQSEDFLTAERLIRLYGGAI